MHCFAYTKVEASQVAAVLVYIFCGIFGTSYVVNFVVVVLLLTLDFWTVSGFVNIHTNSDPQTAYLLS